MEQAAAYPGSAGAAGGAVTKINLNTAVKEQLMTLKGDRGGQGRGDHRLPPGIWAFARIEDIMEVPGIKEAAFRR